MINAKLLIVIILTLSSFIVNGQRKGKSAVLKTELDSISYAMGVYNASIMKQSTIEGVNFKLYAEGFEQSYSDKEVLINAEEAASLINSYYAKERDRVAKENLAKGKAFLEENAKNKDVIVDESGIQYKVVKLGNGPKPLATDKVRVHYHGTKIDGTVFDSSVQRGDPMEFLLNRVIKGWTIGLSKMNVGSKYIFYIPSELAYGPSPRAGGAIKPNEVLIFEVELLEIIE
ncbi:MAG: peptidylprolyl isomerase [Bacteroidetes bacterium HGW-Bacteroidetes-15]|nr:MAG: peptidylprolyl isomerase [Bacteroidetes bacterium HGW-Bacteroidetes-15]